MIALSLAEARYATDLSIGEEVDFSDAFNSHPLGVMVGEK
jgi:hypothetical protein